MKTFNPENKAHWREWLEENHVKEDSVWLEFFRKGSPNYNLSWSDAVDEALCFGWIDSTKRKVDDEKYIQYFCKRKPKSNWSRVNKEKVKMLTEQGLMQEAGHVSIKIAKENGSWSFLDAVEALIIPAELKEELDKHERAATFFDNLSKSDKKILLYWVISAKTEKTRQKRILEIARNASQSCKPKQFR
ncbi:YdeI/OmpD-associated family protein [Jiulongibacter sediminis]|uniref:Bacteriocin-protection protein n=1 Tax=Jiulongibacter sediminis TaxID=1605367 RepID=A0A0P7BRM1_9BACT|nr:YdeI/OmpD-associated family protein [Jiulongibacter sediminis]KPM47667.1 hypothetical protein AFM12_14440 [Jiulongibacter sediminis]TBX23460.1 hypothetical protein TK44_14450 [Jiulongibacter sediminis]